MVRCVTPDAFPDGQQTGFVTRAPSMTVTPQEIEAEHKAALASLTEAQRRAILRLQQAKQRAHFNGRFPDENLKAIFEAEAVSRMKAA